MREKLTPARRDPAATAMSISSGRITPLTHWLQHDLIVHDERLGC